MKRTIISCLLFALTAIAPSAQAGTKEELLRLQNDVLALQNQLRLVEKTFNEKTDGLRSLVVQLNDQIGKSNQILGKISAALETQSMGDKSESQALLQEIRNVSAKVDDSATRISALAQQISDLKVQAKPITQRTYQSPGGDSGNPSLSADAIYTEAFNDLVQGNLDLAIEGFSAFIKNYPSHERADDAQYNIGEAYYNSGKYPQAISAFTRVLNDYPSADKVPSAYFKRAKAELVINERDNAIEDLKIVVQKYSSSPEAGLAKNELSTLGVQLNKPARSGSTRRKP
jgi:tol-pal system protein YbgF